MKWAKNELKIHGLSNKSDKLNRKKLTALKRQRLDCIDHRKSCTVTMPINI